MKKNYILFLMLLAFTSLSAQITITENNLAPAGFTFTVSTDTTVLANIVPGEAGPNKTWDFTSLQVQSTDEIAYMLPEWTPYSDAFPEANFAAYSSGDGDAYAFFVRSDEELAAIGLVGNYDDFGQFTVNLEPKNVYFDFPIQYEDSREETFFFEVNLGNIMDPFDSIRFKQTTHKIATVDAWGSMEIALGTFNVLRIKEETVVSDSIWGKTFGFWSLLSSDDEPYTDYTWETNDQTIGYTLVSMSYDEQSSTVEDVDFLNSFPVGVNNKLETSVNVFPNPTNGIVIFSFNEIINGELCIYDSQSRMLSQKAVGSEKTEIDISKFSTGLYFYNLKNSKGDIVKTGKIIKK